MLSESYLPFSQRNGLSPVPPQLALGEVNQEFRRQVEYYLGLEIDRAKETGFYGSYFEGPWKRVATDFHVLFLKEPPRSFENDAGKLSSRMENLVASLPYGELFNLIEFFIRHPNCSQELQADLSNVFVVTKSAYRILEKTIVTVGTSEQALIIEHAVKEAEAANELSAKQHLLSAALELRNGNWSGSVRESIHAVESMVLRLVPTANSLGPALTFLEKQGHVHGALKTAFGNLYGYSSDEEGVRHALVFNDTAKVDEADSLFMLGACASFVSYLIAKGKVGA